MTVGCVHFVVGMSRCGITPLSRALNLHPDVCVFGESRYFGRCWVEPETPVGYTAAQLDRIERVLRQLRWKATVGDEPGCLRLSLDEMRALVTKTFAEARPPVAPGPMFVAMAEAVAEAEGKRLAFEKTPHHLNWTRRIAAHVPDARFIVMLADPYVFVRFHRDYDAPYHPLAAALQWRGYMRSYERTAKWYPERIVVLDAAQLARDGAAELERVQRFFELEVHDLSAPIAPLVEFLAMPVEPDPGDVFWLNLVCGRLMRRHGYERRRAPFAAGRIARSLASLPRWCFEALPRVKGPDVGRARYLLHWLRP